MSVKILPPNEPLTNGSSISPVWWRNLQYLTQINVGFAERSGADFSADWSQSDEIRLALSGGLTTITNKGASDGQRCLLTLTQDSGGGQTVAFTLETVFDSSGMPQLDATPNTRSHLEFVFNSSLNLYDSLLFVTGLGSPTSVAPIPGPKSILVREGDTLVLDRTNVDVFVDKTIGSPTLIYLPQNPTDAQPVFVVDSKGDAGTNNITVNGFGNLIHGVMSVVINVDYSFFIFVWNGSGWDSK